MNRILSKYIDKLFFKQWVIGICRDNINDIIRSKNFASDINWLPPKSFDKFYADPFLLLLADGNIKIFSEEYKFEEGYGKIALITLDTNFKEINSKILLDTKSHLSYPFVFTENNKYYVFPEAASSGKLSCYEYDFMREKLNFVKDILNLPLLDSTILKHNGKYWIFGTVGENTSTYELNVFFSDNLLGPYTPHVGNPIKSGLNGIRNAGDFIKVNGNIYRPTQNCEKKYGESITFNKINILTELNVVEDPVMTISMNKKKTNYQVHSIHTINVIDNIIVVDGEYWTFSPIRQFRKYVKGIYKKYQKQNQKR